MYSCTDTIKLSRTYFAMIRMFACIKDRKEGEAGMRRTSGSYGGCFMSAVLALAISCSGSSSRGTAGSGDEGSVTVTTTGSGIAAKTTYTFPGGTVMSEIQTTADSLSSNITFPTGTADDSTGIISTPFVMAETDVTYQLWKEVYDWATSTSRGTAVYSFANTGQNGAGRNTSDGFSTSVSTQYPVVGVNWRDAIVWCNALTEYYNANNGRNTDYAVVYCSDSGYSTPIRTSTNSSTIDTTAGTQDTPYVNASAKGFRLPTSAEYEYAARYRGSDSTNTVSGYTGTYYTKGDSASGATASYTDYVITSLFAVFNRNYTDASTFTAVTGTALVKSKNANALGLYDMSGNVLKWNFDYSSVLPSWCVGTPGSGRMIRGTSFYDAVGGAQVGAVGIEVLYSASGTYGFRISRTK
jgi:formylglycine-generating enzyme required for sulfatase activity